MFLERRKWIERNLRTGGYDFDSIRLHIFSRKVTIRSGGNKTTCHLTKRVGMDFPNRYIVWVLCDKRTVGGQVRQTYIGIDELERRLAAGKRIPAPAT